MQDGLVQLDMARDVQRFEVSNKLRKFGIVFRFELLDLCKLENELKKLHNFKEIAQIPAA